MTTLNPISAVRESAGFTRATVGVVLAAFLTMTLCPAVQAAMPQAPRAAARPPEPLDTLKTNLWRMEQAIGVGAPAAAADLQALAQLKSAIGIAAQQARAQFADDMQHIRAHRLPQAIARRHEEASKSHADNHAALMASIEGVESAAQDPARMKSALRHAREAADRLTPKPLAQPLDLKKLPFEVLKGDGKKQPRMTKKAFVADGLHGNPTPMFAAVGAFTYDALPGASDPAYRAATDEVRLTAAIQQKAAELGNDPVRIHDWLRSNMEWQPGWGAYQNAEHTLSSGVGNAFDLSGLMISMLRASGIPARYVHGTIDVPVATMKKWLRGFSSADAMADYIGAAGIPVSTVASGGAITSLRFEHVWVEAALDYFPSRGARNLAADTWVALDPSFGPAAQRQSLGVVEATGIDGPTIGREFEASGVVNAQGYVQGQDPSTIESGYTAPDSVAPTVRDLFHEFLVDNYAPSDAVSLPDLAGGSINAKAAAPYLPASLPYRKIVEGARYATLPASLQARIEFTLGEATAALPFSKANFEAVGLTFRPATADDYRTLVSYLPASASAMSDLPSSLPAYLIRVVPQLALPDGRMLAGPAVALGTGVEFDYTIALSGGRVFEHTLRFPAGATATLLLGGGSPNIAALDAMQPRIAESATILENGTAEDLHAYADNFYNVAISDVFQASLSRYFSDQMTTGRLVAQGGDNGGIVLVSGFGSVAHVPSVRYSFGVPTRIEKGSVQVDVKQLLFNIVSSDGSAQKRRALTLLIGHVGAALEGDAPADMFARAGHPLPQGLSATNALKAAADAGQRIYTVSSANSAQLSNIHYEADAMNEIRAAVSAGLEVVAHTDPVALPGASGLETAGYVILDPVTGAGAYRLDLGINGGLVDTANSMMMTCAYTNRPGFVDNELDAARLALTRQCADYARELKEEAAELERKTVEKKLEAVKIFHEVYAKGPMVIADCISSGAPLILANIAAVIRTAAAGLLVVSAQLTVYMAAEVAETLAKKMKQLLENVHNVCLQGGG